MTAVHVAPLGEELRGDLRAIRGLWWLPLLAGVAWVLVAVVVLRFDYTSVAAISALFGTLALLAAANEVMLAMLLRGGWRLLHLVLAVLFVGTGIVGYVHPGSTFAALAAVVGFFLVFRGSFDLIVAFSTMSVMPGAWTLVITGLAELALGFWAAGSWGLSATLLVAWVGATALLHGIGEIVAAFRLRHLLSEVL